MYSCKLCKNWIYYIFFFFEHRVFWQINVENRAPGEFDIISTVESPLYTILIIFHERFKRRRERTRGIYGGHAEFRLQGRVALSRPQSDLVSLFIPRSPKVGGKYRGSVVIKTKQVSIIWRFTSGYFSRFSDILKPCRTPIILLKRSRRFV